MKKPRKPKKVKYPKLPKRSASLATMLNFKRRCAEVDKKNADRAHEYNRKLSDIHKAKAMYDSLKTLKSKGGKVFKLKVA